MPMGVFKSQSAMEYLMTYGWSILIIAVVLAALFQLGVFSSANFAPKAQPGNCRVLRLAGTVNLEGTCTGILPQSVAMLNGQSSYASFPSYAYVGGNGITVSAWMLLGGAVAKGNIFYAMTGGCSSSINGLAINMGHGGNAGSTFDVILFDNSIGVTDRVSSGSLSQSSWKSIAVTWYPTGPSSSNMLIYLNGALDSTYSVAGAIPSSFSAAAAVGGPAPCWISDPSTFSLANIQVYNASLDASQIQALYIKGIGAAPIDPNHLVAWWPLNGDTNDYSGNNNNGAATGMTYASSWTQGYTPP
jgi:Concanavalin A-like lectin/glucanases superfamily